MAVKFKYLLTFSLIWLCTRDLRYRPNVGVVFEKTRVIYNTNSVWHGIFLVNNPLDKIRNFRVFKGHGDVLPLIRELTCYQNSSSNAYRYCNRAASVIETLNYLRKFTKDRLLNSTDIIKDLLPPEQTVHHSRSRRSLLPFVGNWLSDLFGTSTDARSDELDAKIRKIQSGEFRLEKSFAHFSETSIQEFEMLEGNLNDTAKLLNSLHESIRQLSNTEIELEEEVLVLSSLILNTASTLSDTSLIDLTLSRWMRGIGSLLNGKLSPELVHERELHALLTQITTQLLSKHAGYELLHENIQFYYRYAKINFAASSDGIYVVLDVPLKHRHAEIFLYRVHQLPVPINDTHATDFNVKPYFAASTDGHLYSEWTSQDYEGCLPYQVCTSMPALKPRSEQSSCLSSIFMDDADHIMKSCAFEIINYNISQAIVLRSSFLVTNFVPRNFICDKHQHVNYIPSCRICFLTLPCNCELYDENFEISRRFTDCNETLIQTFATNLVLHRINNVSHVKASTVFRKEIDIPKIHSHLQNMKTFHEESFWSAESFRPTMPVVSIGSFTSIGILHVVEIVLIIYLFVQIRSLRRGVVLGASQPSPVVDVPLVSVGRMPQVQSSVGVGVQANENIL